LILLIFLAAPAIYGSLIVDQERVASQCGKGLSMGLLGGPSREVFSRLLGRYSAFRCGHAMDGGFGIVYRERWLILEQ